MKWNDISKGEMPPDNVRVLVTDGSTFCGAIYDKSLNMARWKLDASDLMSADAHQTVLWCIPEMK